MTTKVNLSALVLALAAVLFAPVAVSADDDGALIQQLEQRLLAAEDKLDASEATIAAQRDLLKTQSAPAVSQGSGLDAFFSKLEVGGHVTASYVYAFEDPSQTTGAAIASQPLCQFNCNHNTFELDAVKLELGRPTDGAGTAGFQLDLLMGANNQILGGQGTAADTDIYVQEAYAAYNYNGIDLKFGKFETLLGYELLDSPANPNISHGLLFTWAIPLVHTGFLASGNISEQLGWSLGITNGFNNITDSNENKGLLGQVTFGDGPMFASVSAYYGADLADNSLGTVANVNVDHGGTDDALILDFVGTYDASDSLGFWVNVDWGEQESVINVNGPFEDMQWYGVALGSKMTISDKMNFAVRGEYFVDENGFRFTGPLGGALAGPTDANAYSLTGTLGYALTENLTARAELRFDRMDVSGSADNIFPSGTAGVDFEEDAYTGYLEVSYSFD